MKAYGSTTAGSLELAEDERGLAVRITPPETTVGSDALENLRNGNLDKTSRSRWSGPPGGSGPTTGRYARSSSEALRGLDREQPGIPRHQRARPASCRPEPGGVCDAEQAARAEIEDELMALKEQHTELSARCAIETAWLARLRNDMETALRLHRGTLGDIARRPRLRQL